MKSQTVSEDEQAYLGIKGTDVSSEYAQYYNLPEGIYVSSVTSGSPAEKAGIKKGDVVVKYKERCNNYGRSAGEDESLKGRRQSGDYRKES